LRKKPFNLRDGAVTAPEKNLFDFTAEFERISQKAKNLNAELQISRRLPSPKAEQLELTG
jgi:hypothetical protein